MADPISSQSTTSIRLPYPKGLLRRVMRLPILLHRLRLGAFLGERFKHASAFRQTGSLLIGQQSREPSEIIQSFVDAVPLVGFSPVHSEAEGQ